MLGSNRDQLKKKLYLIYLTHIFQLFSVYRIDQFFLDVLHYHSVADIEEINKYLSSKYPLSLDTMNVIVSESDL